MQLSASTKAEMKQLVSKSSSLDLYQQRLLPVLALIQSDLSEGLSLTEAAQISHFSKFHFQRIFSALIGESLQVYINRLRLERAANQILYCPDQAITEIALDCGFSGSSAFARAFKKHFGVSAVSIRKYRTMVDTFGESTIKWQPTEAIDSQRLRCFYENMAGLQPFHLSDKHREQQSLQQGLQPIRLQTIAAQHYCTIRSEQGYVLADIINAWNRLFAWARSQGVTEEQTSAIALCHDNPIFTRQSHCRYDASILIAPALVEKIKHPFRHTLIPAGEYAVFSYCGTPNNASDFHMRIYNEWLPQSHYEPDALPCFERYTQSMANLNSECASPQDPVQMEIWVKVIPLAKHR